MRQTGDLKSGLGVASAMGAAVINDPDFYRLPRLAQWEADNIRVREAFASTGTRMHRIDVVLILCDHVPRWPDQLNVHVGTVAQFMFSRRASDIKSVRSLMSAKAHNLPTSRMLDFNRER